MKHVTCTTRAARHLLAIALLAGSIPLLANPAAECRQEVQDYGIPPEQAADYIDGCILSRGGSLDPAAAAGGMPVEEAGNALPVEDAGSMPEIEQTEDAGNPGGVNVTY